MASPRLLLFGDQTVEKVSTIKRLVQAARTSQLLRRFLRGATDVIQVEAAKLATYERKDLFFCDNLLELAEKNAEQDDMGDEVIATTLMCIARLGELIMSGASLLSCGSDTDDMLDTLRASPISWSLRALHHICWACALDYSQQLSPL